GLSLKVKTSFLSEDQFLCSICLDLFTEPVSTPCGHNFCRRCLSHHWDTSAPCRCPLCKELFHIRPELRVNTLLSGLVSQFKQEAGSRSLQQQSRHMVEQRRQKIQELQSSVQLSQRAVDREKSTGLQAFSALIESVQRSRERFIQELQEKHRHIQTQAEALIQQLKQEICELGHFLQHCPALPPTGLKDWSSVRLKLETFEGTAARALTELRETLTDEVDKELQAKLKRVQQFTVDLTLDPGTAHVKLSVSNDLKQVYESTRRMFRDSPQRFLWRNILTKQSFSSGRFYFEVQVKDKTMWTLGVAKESVERRNNQNSLTSKYGYWCLDMTNIEEYFRAPQKVGVFVDYDEGLVSFYDADTADLIYSFTDCSFREKLFPFLNPCYCDSGENSAPLILTFILGFP
uniref:Uncharacterized protein n=1 Tax=Neogobius melanostomus TaxID=47308 RepID=A0A8C6TL85_9GOBI